MPVWRTSLKLCRTASQDTSELIMHPHLLLKTHQPSKTHCGSGWFTQQQHLLHARGHCLDLCGVHSFSPTVACSFQCGKEIPIAQHYVLTPIQSILFTGQILEFKCEWGGGNYHRSEREGCPQTLRKVARSSFLWKPAFSHMHLESKYDKLL